MPLLKTIFILTLTLQIMPVTSAKSDGMYERLKLFADVIEIIQREYAGEVDPQKLIYGALRGMLGSLDPYSQFMEPDLYQEMMVRTRGYFGGLGIYITIKDGLLTVISPIEDTPASLAGIKTGDVIVEIEGETTKEMTLLEAVRNLRGPEGTEVTITIMREGELLPEVTLTRERIDLPSIKEAKIIDDGIGYIRLIEFREETSTDLNEALKDLEKEGMESLVLDLRYNHGGLLDAAVEVADKFLPQGRLIVYTEGRRPLQSRRYLAKTEPRFNYPLVILVNEYSASASEIVAGAIQDWRRGVLIGTRTSGKGSVQTVIPLSDGSALRLTTAKYFTPQGRLIQGKGISPDIEVKRIVKEEEAELPSVPEEGKEGEERPDPQLERAINLLKAWPIFKEIYSLEEEG
ncbi:S41 family peptidase [candidate division NPL-UPA2 bacterium]|nr:S41 family peptidase [candidate division NPL-UPA2 bacterium]